MCMFFEPFIMVYMGRVHGAISGCTVLWEVHPVSAQNKSLISDTGQVGDVLSMVHCTYKIPCHSSKRVG